MLKEKMKYETPEIVVTRFELNRAVMAGDVYGGGGNGEDGPTIPIEGDESATQPGTVPFTFPNP